MCMFYLLLVQLYLGDKEAFMTRLQNLRMSLWRRLACGVSWLGCKNPSNMAENFGPSSKFAAMFSSTHIPIKPHVGRIRYENVRHILGQTLQTFHENRLHLTGYFPEATLRPKTECSKVLRAEISTVWPSYLISFLCVTPIPPA